MAIKPPSDIVLDVVRAADPVKHQAAAERLAQLASPDDGNAFAMLLGKTGPAPLAGSPAVRVGDAHPGGKIPEAYKSFEGFFLQSFLESILPKSSEGTYGEGTAGEVWRSFAAQEFGTVIAEHGGIGIAERLAARDGLAHRTKAEASDKGSEFSLAASLSSAAPFRDWASYLPYLGQRPTLGEPQDQERTGQES